MLWRAKGGCVRLGTTDMDYITFGYGRKPLMILPGLGDGLTTVRGMAGAMAIAYRLFAKDYNVYMFSRKNDLQAGCSTRDMAKDQAQAIQLLGITGAYVLGVSQGGMIAQYLAIDYPGLVEKLVLAVTLSRQNDNIQEVLRNWMAWAEQQNYKQLIIDTAEKSYSEKYLKKYRLLLPLIGSFGKPKDFTRFLIQASACMRHDSSEELNKIICPTLIIAGTEDKIAGSASSGDLADGITGSSLFLYEGLGHAAYEEAKDFNKRVLEFLSK